VLVTQYGIYPFETKDELDAYKFDLEYQLDNDFVRSIEFGYRYSDREYNNDRRAFQYGDANNVSAEEPPLRLTSDMFDVVNFSGDFAAYPSYLSIDLDAALNAWFPNGVPQPAQTWLPSGNFNRDWTMRESGDVFETVNAAYLMANLDFELLDIPVTGNIGVRYVDSKQASTALQPASMIGEFINEDGEIETGPVPDFAAGAQPIVDELGSVNTLLRPAIIEHNYDDWLPSLNLNFQITDNQQLRFAYAKVMGRAPINRFAANASSNVELPAAQQNVDSGVISLSRPTALFNANSNNSPFLEPFYATQYDLSYEYYFEDTDGALIAAFFYKDIESFIQEDRQNPFDFAANGFTIPDEVNVPVVYDNRSGDLAGAPVLDANGDQIEILVPIENGEYVTAFNNDEGGYIRGIELAYTQIYSFLPGMWSGLGVSASYSYTESEIQRVTGNGVFSQNLPGLSENVATVTLFWEYEDFETRISTRYRDDFVSEQVGIGTQTVNFDSEVVVDYQASYNYDENTTVLFQIVNLTDEPTRSFFNTQEQTGTIQYFGTQYFLGVSYTL
jgi:TonB-dependent receptor